MTEYITKDAAIAAAIEAADGWDGWTSKTRDKGITDAINSIPAADVVEVRHGQFLGTEFDGYADGLPVYYEWQCSECGCIFEDEEPTYEFCPCCGAKMDGGQSDG